MFSWELLNNYYDNKNYDTKISTYLFNRLSWFYDIKIELPKVNEILQPILTVISLQLIAYEVAKLNKCDIDKPRNLAKSVTVE